MLFLPPNSNRIAEGGLRTKGLLKFSYKKVRSEKLEVRSDDANTDAWYICDLDANPVLPASAEIEEKILLE